MTKKSTRKTPQQTTHSLEKNSRHKKLDTLSSSQTTHSQEKPANQTSLHAFLKAPEKLTTKTSDLSTRLAMNQATTVQKPCLGKIPIATKPEPALNHQPLAAAGTILTPHTPNPSTQKHVHHNTLLLSLATNAWWSLSIQKFLLSGAALIQKTSGGAAPLWGGPATLSQAKLRQTLETNQAMSRTASATASATRVSKAPGMM